MAAPRVRLRRRVHGPTSISPASRDAAAAAGPRSSGHLDSEARVDRSVALPPPPPAHVRRRRRSGAGRAHAVERRHPRQGASRLPVRRLARDRQDEHGEDPRRLPELRAGADHRALRRVRVVRLDRQRDLARRDRDGRRLQQLGRRHPRPAREGRLRPRLRPPQGLHPRRGPHALPAGLERVSQDARGAAAADDLRARHDRGPEGAADRGRPLPSLRLRPADGRAGGHGPAPGGRQGADRDRAGRGRPDRPARDRQLPRRARHARAARHLRRRRADHLRRRARGARRGRRRAAVRGDRRGDRPRSGAGAAGRGASSPPRAAIPASCSATSRSTAASCWPSRCSKRSPRSCA